MAAIAKIIRKGNSVHQTAQYEKLAQEPSDNEEEDDVLFKREALAKQNGHTPGAQNGVAGESIEMTKTDKNGTNNNTDSITAEELNLVKFKVVKRATALWRTRVSCFVLLLVLVLLLGLILAFIVPYFRNVEKVVVHHVGTKGWSKQFNDTGTESCIRLFDVDGDGLEDVIIGLQFPFAQKNYQSVDEMKQTCKDEGLDFPCEGEVVALRGTDGYILWKTKMQSSVTDINCENIDVNKDGQKDCIVSGKHGALAAINSKSGAVLWNLENQFINIEWNIYQPLPLPDWDNDGIPELLVAHGGDYKYGPELTLTREDLIDKRQRQQVDSQKMKKTQQKVKEDEGGRLFVVSGASGKVMGRFMDIPRNREIYVPPTMHTTFDRSKYFMFGSGSIGDMGSDGSLYIMSVPDLYRYVMNTTNPTVPGAGQGSYKGWQNLPVNSANVYQIYKSDSRGVMAPPICVDINKDGVKDILLNAYDGNVIMYNGENLTVIWQAKFPGFESHSVPAPGHFNDDDTVDFMIHLNYGKWPEYFYSLTVILDGKSGSTLWSLNSTMVQYSSDIVLRTKNKNRDAFLFRVQGIFQDDNKEKSKDDKKEEKERQKRAVPYNQQQYQPYQQYVGRKTYQRPEAQMPQGQYQNQQQQPRYQSRTHVDSRNNGAQFPAYVAAGREQQAPQPEYEEQRYNPYARYPYQNENENNYENTGYEPSYEDRYQDYGSDFIPDVKTWLENFGHYGDIKDEQDIFKTDSECVQPLAKYKVGIFLMDRSNMWMPLKVFVSGVTRFYYNITFEDTDTNTKTKQKRDLSWIRPQKTDEKGQLCIVMKPVERVNAAVGDLDGDGNLDIVTSLNLYGEVIDESGFHVKNVAETHIVKINIADVMSKERLMPLNVTLSGGMKANKNTGGNLINEKFLPLKQQPWLSYMGTHGDSVFGSRH